MTFTVKSLSAIILAAVCCVSAEDGSAPLFNGKDLEGWVPRSRASPPARTSATRSASRTPDQSPLRRIWRRVQEPLRPPVLQDPFTNYVLRIEYRFVDEQLPDGPGWAKRNSGAMIHGQSPESMRKDQDFPVSSRSSFSRPRLRQPHNRKPVHAGHACRAGRRTLHAPRSQLNIENLSRRSVVTVEIEARGSQTIIHRIDGATVLQYDKPQYDPKDGDANA
jgi:hypothetical protein